MSEAPAANPIVIRWPSRQARDDIPMLPATCPTCGAHGTARLLLEATARFDGPPVETRLLSCTACGCAFVADPVIPEYAEDSAPPAAVLAFYTQHSAGILQIVQTLARVRRPAGSRLLDIGCGFGFGLDFAAMSLGWRGQGIDPAGLAQAGRVELGVPIAHRMFEPGDAAGQAEVVMASEVLEHLPEPAPFVALLRAALAPGGVLVLSTPDAGSLRPEAPDSLTIPVLSLGQHLVLQSAGSLEKLLRAAGFAEVSVRANGMSLIAYASDQPLELVEDDAALEREYGAYLARRLTRSGSGGDVWLGFAARRLIRALHVEDWTAFDPLLARLDRELLVRFGFSTDQREAMPELAAIATPDQWAEQVPFSLAELLHARLLGQLLRGVDPAGLLPLFTVTADAARETRRVIRMMNADSSVLQQIEALSPIAAVRGAILQAVNAGDYPRARDMLARFDRLGLEPAPGAMLDDTEARFLFAMGMLDLQPGGTPGLAAARLARVRGAMAASLGGGHARQIFMAALQGELQAAEMQGDEPGEARLYALLAELPQQQQPWPAELRRMQALYRRRTGPAGRLRRALRERLPALARLARRWRGG